MSNPKATHLLRHHPARQSPDGRGTLPPVTELFRLSDGLKLGEQTVAVVAFGEDPTRISQRFFMDAASATKFLQKIAHEDEKDGTAVFEDENLDKRVVSAEDAVGRRFN